jgi:mono/diheme cytochrome c family protein
LRHGLGIAREVGRVSFFGCAKEERVKFVPVGILIILGLIAVAVYVYLQFGFLSFRADQRPSAFEEKYAMAVLDASTERHAPVTKNPIQPTEANLLDGMKRYDANCAGCHGDPGDAEPVSGRSFYPRAPQFVKTPPDMPDNQTFYIIKYGVRWTGMPAWGDRFSDDQIWGLATFLSQMDKLPASVDQEWKKGASAMKSGNRK